MKTREPETIEELCASLLDVWTSALFRLQIRNTGDPRIDGALVCPACGKIHGRCFEAMYPFLHMASATGDDMWVEASIALFDWAEAVVSQPDGSFLNDIDSPWKGTTVFNVIQMVDCLSFHGKVLPGSFVDRLSSRVRKAADFLYGYTGLKDNNINYPVSNALAMYLCGRYFNEKKYFSRAEEFGNIVMDCFTSNGLLFGEGIPRSSRTAKKCPSVDIGYNVEESLPSLARFALLTDNKTLTDVVGKSLYAHLDFMLDDGGWDNSFGTRNFKWTYWGSRTSDGCAAGYLAFGEENPVFVEAAVRNLELMRKCTIGGLLSGGLHYGITGQPVCIHHTFTHSKVLASILDDRLCRGVVVPEKKQPLPRMQKQGIRRYPEIDTFIMTKNSLTATVTGYDWEYMRAGHASGGTLSMLFHEEAGVLLCAGMCEYSIKEKNNQQIPVGSIPHACLSPRLETVLNGRVYSSMYDFSASMEKKDDSVVVHGFLSDIEHVHCNIGYEICYTLQSDGLLIKVSCGSGCFVCPVVYDKTRDIVLETEKSIGIDRGGHNVVFEVEDGGQPYFYNGWDTIFNLVPGFAAVPICLDINGSACCSIHVIEKRQG